MFLRSRVGMFGILGICDVFVVRAAIKLFQHHGMGRLHLRAPMVIEMLELLECWNCQGVLATSCRNCWNCLSLRCVCRVGRSSTIPESRDGPAPSKSAHGSRNVGIVGIVGNVKVCLRSNVGIVGIVGICDVYRFHLWSPFVQFGYMVANNGIWARKL